MWNISKVNIMNASLIISVLMNSPGLFYFALIHKCGKGGGGGGGGGGWLICGALPHF